LLLGSPHVYDGGKGNDESRDHRAAGPERSPNPREHTPQSAKSLYGVPGATAGKCAVSPVAQNITFFPGVRLVRNARKINARIQANVRGFLATL
jgi:hypothetical protein